MTPVITLFFALGTALELFGLKVVSTQISVVNTLNLIMLTFLVGVVVGRSWGKHFFEKMQWHLKSRTLPNDEVLNGTVMTIASMLLITPGVITDVLGLVDPDSDHAGHFQGNHAGSGEKEDLPRRAVLFLPQLILSLFRAGLGFRHDLFGSTPQLSRRASGSGRSAF